MGEGLLHLIYPTITPLNDYHQPSDEYSDDWDMTGIEQTIDTIFNVSLNLANSDMWPNWYEDNEFRSIRDKQRE